MIRTVSELSSFILPAAAIGAVTIGIVPGSALGAFSYLATQIIDTDVGYFSRKTIVIESPLVKPETIKMPTDEEISNTKLKKELLNTITRFVAAWAFATAFGLTTSSILPSLGILFAVFVIHRHYQELFKETLGNTIEKTSNRVLGYAK